MIRVKVTISVALICMLTIVFIPKQAVADVHSTDKPIRLYATERVGPIGVVESIAGVTINGKPAFEEQMIWGGELVRAARMNARIRLDSIGEVRLIPGAIVKIATATTTFDDLRGEVLIASIVSGSIAVRLEDRAGAYVEAAGKTFSSSAGASFRIAVSEAGASVSIAEGMVSEVQAPQRNYKIRPVGIGATISVRARESRQIQFRVTDENDRPVPDVPVVFVLGGSGGSLGTGAAAGTTVTVTTNAQGIATTSFTAGPTASSASVTATVAGTSVSATVGVTTTAAAAGILSGTTLGIVAAAAAAATVATVTVANNNTDENDNITAQPPTVKPRP